MTSPILLFADRLPPLVGGMEMHAGYFIRHFQDHWQFPLMAVISKDHGGTDCLVSAPGREPVDPEQLAARYEPAILFFNSGRWIEDLRTLRSLFPHAEFTYRTGGNEILKAPLERAPIESHADRRRFWVDALNDTIDTLVTNSAFTEGRLRDAGVRCPFLRCVGGVNFSAVSRPRPMRRGPPVLLCAARFVPYKHHALLIQVAAALKARGHAFQLRLAGDGPLLEETRALVRGHGLDPMVRFLGALPHEATCAEIAAADVYVQLSGDVPTPVPGGSYVHAEGMGRSILEALSAGTYVIAGRSGALHEIVQPGRGELIDIGQPEQVVEALSRVLADPSERRAPTDAYDWSHLFARYTRHWEERDAAARRH
ncbi:MAG TPA: glycosyltransferase [Longimicrobium sp.]|nr:glycosyltransferase [Longimicrobium sp.]